MKKVKFEWAENKNQDNQEKHNVPFEFAQYAFADPGRVIAEDLSHSQNEKRYYCFGAVGEGIITVRLTYRGNSIRPGSVSVREWCRCKAATMLIILV